MEKYVKNKAKQTTEKQIHLPQSQFQMVYLYTKKKKKIMSISYWLSRVFHFSYAKIF